MQGLGPGQAGRVVDASVLARRQAPPKPSNSNPIGGIATGEASATAKHGDDKARPHGIAGSLNHPAARPAVQAGFACSSSAPASPSLCFNLGTASARRRALPWSILAEPRASPGYYVRNDFSR